MKHRSIFMLRQSGVSLLEVILVLTVGLSILLMSINQYQSYRTSADAAALKYNVNLLAQAATLYYKANCNLSTTSSSYPLDPTTISDTVIVSIPTALVGSYLSQPLPLNPLVDNGAGDHYSGYYLQFNKITSTRYACQTPVNSSLPVTGTTVDQNCQTTVAVGTQIDWQAQISVKLNNNALASYVGNLTSSTCTSSMSTGGIVSCSNASTFSSICLYWANLYNSYTGTDIFSQMMRMLIQRIMSMNQCSSTSAGDYNNYLVYNFMPSIGTTSQTQSGLWFTDADVLQFKRQYTTYPINNLLETKGLTPTSSSTQYFYCGS